MQLHHFLTKPDDANLCHKVTNTLNEGWQLYGKPSIRLMLTPTKCSASNRQL